jgi:hypothetical protein
VGEVSEKRIPLVGKLVVFVTPAWSRGERLPATGLIVHLVANDPGNLTGGGFRPVRQGD